MGPQTGRGHSINWSTVSVIATKTKAKVDFCGAGDEVSKSKSKARKVQGKGKAFPAKKDFKNAHQGTCRSGPGTKGPDEGTKGRNDLELEGGGGKGQFRCKQGEPNPPPRERRVSKDKNGHRCKPIPTVSRCARRLGSNHRLAIAEGWGDRGQVKERPDLTEAR